MSGLPPMLVHTAPPLTPRPPAWALEQCAELSLLSAHIDHAVALTASQLVDGVSTLYRSLSYELQRQRRHPVRIWNFVPDIQGHLDGGDRYMTFNTGRFAAYRDWFGGVDAFPSSLPTASAVGVAGGTLSVYVLASDRPGVPVENPRQVSSYHYSRRYGIFPPCFSRATMLGSTLLIGGTASIVGQHSLHEDDIEAQLVETCRNIAALIQAAAPHRGAAPLQTLRSLRVHVLNSEHAADVHAFLAERLPRLQIVELVQAALCRRELLVEIEGVATLDR